MTSGTTFRVFTGFLCTGLVLLIAGCSLGTQQALRSTQQILLAPQWQGKVLSQGHSRIDNIVVLPDETVYATLEQGKNQGSLIAIKNGKVAVLMEGLNRPDGLTFADGVLYLTEEVSAGRIWRYRLSDGKRQVLARLAYPEGIALMADQQLLISEDRINGRIVHLTPQGVSVWAEGLQRPEGICFDSATQRLYVAETATGRILSIKNGDKTVLIDGLHQPDQVECADDGSIWITEDLKSGRLLRYFQGQLQVIADALDEPQGISLGKDGQVYVAEQGRGRILRLNKLMNRTE